MVKRTKIITQPHDINPNTTVSRGSIVTKSRLLFIVVCLYTGTVNKIDFVRKHVQ